MNLLISLAAFVVAIGILVTVHEFGHYWVARRCGVKVLRFSVGFGRPLLKWYGGPDRTEYVIAAVPLGGYVKMLDEREGDVPPEERDRAFNRKPVGQRIAVVAAGPLFNFMFAVLAYALMFMLGVNGVKPVVGEVSPDTPAARAGITPQSVITRVGRQPVRTWEEVRLAILNEGLGRERLEVETRTDEGLLQRHELELHDAALLKEEGDFLPRLGLVPWRPLVPQVAKVGAGGAAERAGLKRGDLILAVDGRPLEGVQAWIDYIQAHRERSMRVTVERDGRVLELTLTPQEKLVDGRSVGFINAQIGAGIPAAQRERLQVVVAYGPLEAAAKALDKTWDMTVLTLRVLGRLVMGEASVKNISGPIAIAEYAGISAVIGVSAFLSFLAVVSVSLGVLNLLPVPVLDGGHLLYYLIEVVKGGPLSEQAQALGQRIGLALLAALMVLALYNDITRLLD